MGWKPRRYVWRSFGGALVGLNYATRPYETTLGYVWATVSRGVFFGVVAYAATAVRNRQEADAAARIQALEERRQLEEDLVAVSEHEQQRIGWDLHDGLCQQLAAIGLAARSLADDHLHQGKASAKGMPSSSSSPSSRQWRRRGGSHVASFQCT